MVVNDSGRSNPLSMALTSALLIIFLVTLASLVKRCLLRPLVRFLASSTPAADGELGTVWRSGERFLSGETAHLLLSGAGEMVHLLTTITHHSGESSPLEINFHWRAARQTFMNGRLVLNNTP